MKTFCKLVLTAISVLFVAGSVFPIYAASPYNSFRTVLYTGNGSSQSITGVGFKPDLVWVKARTHTDYHRLYDSVRGAEKSIASNSTDMEVFGDSGITTYDEDGFSVGASNYANRNGADYVAWCWKAGNGTVTNTDGTITSEVNAGETMSIVRFIGSGVGGATVGHGLKSAPKMVIVKSTTNSAYYWMVYHESLSGNTYLLMNLDFPGNTKSGGWHDTEPTNDIITLGSSGHVSGPNEKFIAYCFAEIPGISSFGSYTGNGSTNGPEVNCGFKPAFVMVKKVSDTGDWIICDKKRDQLGFRLKANSSEIETSSSPLIAATSNGFKVGSVSNAVNTNGGTYIYMAFTGFSVEEQFTVEGNVGIGVLNPTKTLEVNGTIKAKEVIVTSDWADYVFKPDYNLLNLIEVESYIDTNGHLPGVPPEQQISNQGVSIAQMFKLQMQKIEELTLYIIDQNKRIGELEATLKRKSK